MTLFKLIFIVSCAVYLLGAKAEISDKRLCADKDCSEPISKVRTLMKYVAAEEGMLSFGPNEQLTVYSKAAGRNSDLWGAEYKGKRGYIPTRLVQEIKVFKTDLKFVVDTELVNKEVPSDNSVPPIQIEPNKPDSVVVDGTTIYNSDIDISSTFKEPHVEPTALPQDTIKVDNTVNQAQVDEPQKTVDSEDHGVNQNSSVPDGSEEFEEDDDDYMIVEEYSEEDEESVEDSDIADKDVNLSTGDIEEEKPLVKPEPDTEINLKEANIMVNEIEPEKPQSPDDSNTNDVEHPEPETKKVSPVFEELMSDDPEKKDDAVKIATDKPENDGSEYPENLKESIDNGSTDTKKEHVTTNTGFYHVVNNINLSSDVKGSVMAENVTTEELPMGNVNDEKLSLRENVDDQIKESIIGDNKVEESVMTENVTTEELPMRNVNDEKLASMDVDDQIKESIIGDNKVEEFVVNEKDSTLSTNDGQTFTEKVSTDTVETMSRESGFYKPYVTSFYSRGDNLEKVENLPAPKVSDDHHLPIDNTADQPVKLDSEVPSFADFNYQQSKEKEANTNSQSLHETSDIDNQKSVIDDTLPAPIDEQTNTEKDELLSESSTETSDNFTPTESPIIEKDTQSITEQPDIVQKTEEVVISSDIKEEIEPQEEGGYLSFIFDMFGGDDNKDKATKEGAEEYVESNDDVLLSRRNDHADSCATEPFGKYCTNGEKPAIMEPFTDTNAQEEESFLSTIDLHDLLKLLGVSGATIVVFLWGYIIIDKMRKEGPLIAKINNLEKALLVTTKENQILTEKLNESDVTSKDNVISNEIIEELKAELENSNSARAALEEQMQSLEKELENSTEVGLELNRMLTDILSSQNGSDALMSNIEQLQNKLVEQQSTINNINASLSEKETANHELQLELEINNKKVIDLQNELDKMVENLLKIEEEKEVNQNKYENQIESLKQAANAAKQSCDIELNTTKKELSDVLRKLKETQRNLELKNNEYNLLKDNVKTIGSNNDISSLLDANSIKAEMQQLQQEKAILTEHLQQHQQLISNLEAQVDRMGQDLKVYQEKYEEADREKLQVITKLDVLNTYFKEKEAELQKEIAKHESMWMEKQGEASTTVGRIKFMQEEIQNFKAQNESLKQEIISQEVELKSQISVLEKKAHESWVAARQAERKLEDVKQEAATLRNRLTLRERSINEDKSQNRLQSPLESNGEHPLSPLHMNVETPASPPLIYGTRDHLTTSPPLPGLPPFLPPPPGVPFIPPPIPGIPPFMPPPPNMFPGDHRPPPLGRMSSPPLNSRYSPDSRSYLHYDRNSPSPTDDEYYGISHRGYSPYNGRDNRRDYGRNTHRSNNKKGGGSSGSGNSNDSLDKINRHNSKV